MLVILSQALTILCERASKCLNALVNRSQELVIIVGESLKNKVQSHVEEPPSSGRNGAQRGHRGGGYPLSQLRIRDGSYEAKVRKLTVSCNERGTFVPSERSLPVDQ